MLAVGIEGQDEPATKVSETKYIFILVENDPIESSKQTL